MIHLTVAVYLLLYLIEDSATLIRAAVSGRYDRSVSVFSPEGELQQVQYAERAASLGAPLVCVQLNSTALLLLTPSLPREEGSLVDRRLQHKLNRVTVSSAGIRGGGGGGVWMGSAGLAGDAGALLRFARSFASDFNFKFNDFPSAAAVAHSIGDLQHATTLRGGERPYGAHALILGFGEPETLALKPSSSLSSSASKVSAFVVRASGQVTQWRAVAIGESAEEIEAALEASGDIEWDGKTSLALRVKRLTQLLQRIVERKRRRGASEGRGGDGDVQGVDAYLFNYDAESRDVHKLQALGLHFNEEKERSSTSVAEEGKEEEEEAHSIRWIPF